MISGGRELVLLLLAGDVYKCCYLRRTRYSGGYVTSFVRLFDWLPAA